MAPVLFLAFYNVKILKWVISATILNIKNVLTLTVKRLKEISRVFLVWMTLQILL
ncbi:hypothetical protein SRABI133_03620 [Peribacillus simplex]|uniref:Uncharacterized protein n=1 Tax=Peribacillus simplex TaxID=1478 RepID=A0A9W4L6V7_9BACI|nr:hypothetical protein SRABI133_03620 [Peribacillus simplex]